MTSVSKPKFSKFMTTRPRYGRLSPVDHVCAMATSTALPTLHNGWGARTLCNAWRVNMLSRDSTRRGNGAQSHSLYAGPCGRLAPSAPCPLNRSRRERRGPCRRANGALQSRGPCIPFSSGRPPRGGQHHLNQSRRGSTNRRRPREPRCALGQSNTSRRKCRVLTRQHTRRERAPQKRRRRRERRRRRNAW